MEEHVINMMENAIRLIYKSKCPDYEQRKPTNIFVTTTSQLTLVVSVSADQTILMGLLVPTMFPEVFYAEIVSPDGKPLTPIRIKEVMQSCHEQAEQYVTLNQAQLPEGVKLN